MDTSPVVDLGQLCRQEPSLALALGQMLDRLERRGKWTRTITLPPAPGLEAALRTAFSGPAVKRIAHGILLDLRCARAALPATAVAATAVAGAVPVPGRDEEPGADSFARVLYSAIGRPPRDPRRESLERDLAIERALGDALASASTEASRSWARAELRALRRGQSEIARGRHAPSVAMRLARDVVRTVDAAIAVEVPVRIQTFSAKVLGSSKALRPPGDLFRLASAALHDHDAATRELVELMGVPASLRAARSLALEARGVYRDEVAASVLCFGPIVYVKQRERFDDVARHAARGESSRLVQHQLRDAVLEAPRARRVTIFENLTPYLDYVDELVRRSVRDEIVVCSSGQASWAVVRLIELCARHGLPMRHAGDLDRSGVIILRSLVRRTGARIRPLCMGPATHRRFAARGQPITDAEKAALRDLLARDPEDAAGHDLLREIARTGVWIEQEAFADECLARIVEV